MHANIDDFTMPSPDTVEAVANRLRLLSDPTRLAIVCALAQGESNPSCLAELAGVGVPAVSQHLAKLRLAGLCRPRRDGQRVWYELVDAGVRDLVRQLLDPVSGGSAPAPAPASGEAAAALPANPQQVSP
ncbi:MAG TPA: metalloregulator ArsR/SmtB family transcription factor [Frankiaceae bacterium]|nr:metalloregulator ArsR/SmtB family transcription factor [Frankiaceae bacterium]